MLVGWKRIYTLDLSDIITIVGDNTGHFLVLIAFYPGNLLVGTLLVRCLFIVCLLFARCLLVFCSLLVRLYYRFIACLSTFGNPDSFFGILHVRDRNRGLYHISVTVRIAHSTSITC